MTLSPDGPKAVSFYATVSKPDHSLLICSPLVNWPGHRMDDISRPPLVLSFTYGVWRLVKSSLGEPTDPGS